MWCRPIDMYGIRNCRYIMGEQENSNHAISDYVVPNSVFAELSEGMNAHISRNNGG